MFDEDGWIDGNLMFLYSSENPLFLTIPLQSHFWSGSPMFPLSALGSFPHLSLEHHHDSVNLSCSSCGWFPRPSLLWKFTNEKGDAISDPQSSIYSEQENGLFCIYNWVILSSSVSNKISCSVILSEDEKRNARLDLGAQLSGVLQKHYT